MISKEELGLKDWTPEKLKKFRKECGLRQSDIGELMGVSGVCISTIETGKTNNPWTLSLYGEILERYYAYKRGYVASFRKVGENNYMEVKI